MDAIVLSIMIWIGFTTGLDPYISVPEVRIVSQSELNSVGPPYGDGRDILKNGYEAKYRYIQNDIRFPGYGTIYLLDSFDKTDVTHLALLEHEIFHHFQFVYSISYDFQNKREYEANIIQRQYLKDNKNMLKDKKFLQKFDDKFLNRLKRC